MGDHRALGFAGGARRVHDAGQVIEADLLDGGKRLRFLDCGFVRAAGAEPEGGLDLAKPGKGECGLGKIAVKQEHARRGVVENVAQFRHGEAGVQRQEHRPEPAAGELDLEGVGGVLRQHRDAVAARDRELVAEVAGKTRKTGVELRIGEAAAAGEIDHRDLVRRPAAVVRDPVIIADG